MLCSNDFRIPKEQFKINYTHENKRKGNITERLGKGTKHQNQNSYTPKST